MAFKKASDQEKKNTECNHYGVHIKQKVDKQPTPMSSTKGAGLAKLRNDVIACITCMDYDESTRK